MGSTIVGVLVDKGFYSIGHAGDSRIYRVREGVIEQLTRDHSLVMEQVRRGLLTLEEAQHSEMQNIIIRALGPEDKVQADLDDQVEACRRVFASDTRWTVVRGSDLEEGESQGLPVWSRHVGDPILESNLTRRVDFALFMVEALENDELVHEAPAIVGRQTPSALAHAVND